MRARTTFEAAQQTLVRNIRYAVRALFRSPAFAFTALTTLALAIGANTAVYSVVNAVLLRPLPYPAADRIVHVMQTKEGSPVTWLGAPRLEDWNRQNSTFDAITGYAVEDTSDTTGDTAERVRRARVTPRLLEVWGIPPAIGRGFEESEYLYGGAPAVLISDRYWRNRFSADANVLSKEVHLGTKSYPIVGVMPASFRFPEQDVDLWIPEAVNNPFRQRRQDQVYIAVGRLKPGVTLERAQSDLAVVQAGLAELFPETDRDIVPRLESLKDTIVGEAGTNLWIVFAAVFVLLVIACTNIAALLLTRATRRRPELVLRHVLGASRASIFTQLVTETAVLSLIGAFAGLLVAAGALRVFRGLAPNLPRLDEASIDSTAFLYAIGTSVLVSVLVGLGPAIRSTRGEGKIEDAARTQVSSRHSPQWTLVAVQVAMSVTLLACAGLLLRSSAALSKVDLSFDPSGVLAFHVSGSYDEVRAYDRVVQRINETIDGLRDVPGVTSAATAALLPGVGSESPTEFKLFGSDATSDTSFPAEWRMVAPSYFATTKISLLSGELCQRKAVGEARAGATIDAMVNHAFAERYFAARSVIGQLLSNPASIYLNGRVTGVVRDAREVAAGHEPVPTVYFCDSVPGPFPWFLVRVAGDPLSVAGAVRAKIGALDPLRSVYDVSTLTTQIADTQAENRLRTYMVVCFAASALALACLGIFGTLSYIVSLRRREVALRVALGAMRSRIVSQLLKRVVIIVGGSCVGGLAVSLASGSLLSSILFGITASDPLTLATVVILVMLVAIVAALIPAIRASFTPPMIALRDE